MFSKKKKAISQNWKQKKGTLKLEVLEVLDTNSKSTPHYVQDKLLNFNAELKPIKDHIEHALKYVI